MIIFFLLCFSEENFYPIWMEFGKKNEMNTKPIYTQMINVIKYLKTKKYLGLSSFMDGINVIIVCFFFGNFFCEKKLYNFHYRSDNHEQKQQQQLKKIKAWHSIFFTNKHNYLSVFKEIFDEFKTKTKIFQK